MAASGRLVWVPAGVKGLRITGWENKIKNMPEDKTSDYATFNMYILDDIDPNDGAGNQGNAAQLRHAQFCNNMRDIFTNTLKDFSVHSVRMRTGQKSKHLLDFIEAEMQNKTEDDLVIFCYQGIAGGDGIAYNFRPVGPGPSRVNAHKLITKVNESQADALFILDCFFPTKSIQHWNREDHMTEIIVAGDEMHDTNGRTTTGSQSFAEGFADSMRGIVAKPRGQARQTIPRIMGRDTNLCSKPLRYWLNKPDRMHPDRRVWRIFADVGTLRDEDADQLKLRRCEVTGRRRGEFGGDPELDNDGWGSDGGSDGDDGDDNHDGDEDGYQGGDDDSHGGNVDGEHGDDGDSSNGGWGRAFGRSRRRAPRRERLENNESVGDDDHDDGRGSGNVKSVSQQWAQLRDDLGLPSTLNDAEAVDLVKRLQSLPKQLRHRKRVSSHRLPTPSSSGIRRRVRDKRPVPAGTTARGRPDITTRFRVNPPVTPDCEITAVQRLRSELRSPIVPFERTDVVKNEGPVSWWLEKVDIKQSASPAAQLGDSPFPERSSAAEQDMSADSDLEITSVRPRKRRLGLGEWIEAIDLTGDPNSLFVPEWTGRGGRRSTAGSEDGGASLFSFN